MQSTYKVITTFIEGGFLLRIINNAIKKEFKEYGFWDFLMKHGIEFYEKQNKLYKD